MRRFREVFSDLATAAGFALFMLSVILVLIIVVAIPFGDKYSFFGFIVLFFLTIAGGLVFTFGVLLNKRSITEDDLSPRYAVPVEEGRRRRWWRPRRPRLGKPSWLRGYATLNFQDPRQRRRLIFFVGLGVIEVMLMATGGFRLALYSETSEFCGQMCHTPMNPEFIAYEQSPHARVDCAACHVGPGATWLVKSKINGLPQLAAVAFDTFPRPILSPVEHLRPARDTCEQCHWPQRFAGDMVRVNRHYDSDEENTERVDTLLMKIGGGQPDAASGIHWHVGAEVWYLPLDRQRQEIGWVGVTGADGQLVEYIDPARSDEIDAELIESEKRLMDCIDCHNRATHIFYSPDELIDRAMAQGTIDRELPFIKREAINALDPVNPSVDEANIKVEAIDEFYRTYYPVVYTEKGEAIAAAIEELKEIVKLTTFPDMGVSWETHPNNIGHTEWPGCLRCHGKLVPMTTAADPAIERIGAECNLCHYQLSGLQ